MESTVEQVNREAPCKPSDRPRLAVEDAGVARLELQLQSLVFCAVLSPNRQDRRRLADIGVRRNCVVVLLRSADRIGESQDRDTVKGMDGREEVFLTCGGCNWPHSATGRRNLPNASAKESSSRLGSRSERPAQAAHGGNGTVRPIVAAVGPGPVGSAQGRAARSGCTSRACSCSQADAARCPNQCQQGPAGTCQRGGSGRMSVSRTPQRAADGRKWETAREEQAGIGSVAG